MAESDRIEVVPTDHFPSACVVEVGPTRVESWEVVRYKDPARDENRRWSGVCRSTVAALTGGRLTGWWSRSVTTGATTVDAATFLRMIDVPGERLDVTLAAWWRDSAHDDDHLDFATRHRVGGDWLLNGALKTAAFARPIPVELSLCAYRRRWTRLELTPRRTVHPNRIYFREGNHALDRLVSAVRQQDALVEAYQEAASEQRTHRGTAANRLDR